MLNRGLAYSIKQTRTRNGFPSFPSKELDLMESHLQQGHVPNTLKVIENFPLTSLNLWDPKEYYSSKKPALYNGLMFLLAVNVFEQICQKKLNLPKAGETLNCFMPLLRDFNVHKCSERSEFWEVHSKIKACFQRLRNLLIKASVLHPFVPLLTSARTMPQHRTEHLTGSIQQKKIKGVGRNWKIHVTRTESSS